MSDRWMTNAHTTGRNSVCKLQDGFRRDGVAPRGVPLEEYGEPIPSCDHPRYCIECGKMVCKYKDSHMDNVYCYAHDHLTPWTRPYIVGPGGVSRNQWTCGRGILDEDGEESYG